MKQINLDNLFNSKFIQNYKESISFFLAYFFLNLRELTIIKSKQHELF